MLGQAPRDIGGNAKTRLRDGNLDMTPMVDVTFLLLIFFMVTASFSLQKTIAFPPQQADVASVRSIEAAETEVEVQVDEFGSFLVIAPKWTVETPGKHRLVAALKDASSGSANRQRLYVQIHEMAKLRSLVDALDAGTMAGFTDVKVTQVEGD